MTNLPRLDSTTLADQAYAALRTAIIKGQLEPGSKVTERGLAESLAVSPTPVREAILRLEHDHLVERVGVRTVRVTDYDPQIRAELALAESSLSAVAARIATRKATEADLTELTRCLDDADVERGLLRDQVRPGEELSTEAADTARRLILALRGFHNRLIASCRNPVLIHLIRMAETFSVRDRQAALIRRLEHSATGFSGRYDEHRAILAALRARDEDEVERLLHLHSRTANDDNLHYS